VIDLDATLGKQFLEVPIRQPEPQIPADRKEDHLGWNRKPANAEDSTTEGTRGRRGLIWTPSPPSTRSANATVPFVKLPGVGVAAAGETLDSPQTSAA
jgi:hypothetical protein